MYHSFPLDKWTPIIISIPQASITLYNNIISLLALNSVALGYYQTYTIAHAFKVSSRFTPTTAFVILLPLCKFEAQPGVGRSSCGFIS